MANYRQIHVSIWKDEWFLELNTQEKLFFIYIFSNECASLSGIYKIAMKVMVFETGLEQSVISEILAKFEKAGKAYYQDGIMWVVNMRKHNPESPKVRLRVLADVGSIPDCSLKQRYIEHYAPSPEPQAPVEQKADTPKSDVNTLPEATDTVSIGYPYSIDTDPNNIKLNDIKDREAAAPNPSTPEPARNGTEKHESIEALQVYFLTKTGVPVPRRPKGNKSAMAAWQKLWGTPLGEILTWTEFDVGQAQSVIGKAVARMRADTLTISDPNSIIKTARSIWGEMHVNGNGNGAEVPAEEYG